MENDFEYVASKMSEEGFDYCFRHYDNFEFIDDKEFHNLRKMYIAVADKLENYINNKLEQDLENPEK